MFTLHLPSLLAPPRRALTALVLAAVAAVAAVAGSAGTAFARIVRNTIDPVAFVTHQGRQLTVSGPLACDRVEWIDQRVTVTQRASGAVAEGRLRLVCGTAQQQWELQVAAHGNEAFEPGPAVAVAVAVASSAGAATDAHQWLVNITLVAQ